MTEPTPTRETFRNAAPAVEVELLVASVKELKDNSSSADVRCDAVGFDGTRDSM